MDASPFPDELAEFNYLREKVYRGLDRFFAGELFAPHGLQETDPLIPDDPEALSMMDDETCHFQVFLSVVAADIVNGRDMTNRLARHKYTNEYLELLQRYSDQWIALISGIEQSQKVKRELVPSVRSTMTTTTTTTPSNSGPPRKRHKETVVKTLNSTIHLALNEVVLKQGFLHWSDAVSFGKASKECYSIYKQNSKHILQPLLEHLDSMIGSHLCDNCFDVLVPQSKRTCRCAWRNTDASLDQEYVSSGEARGDPRYQDGYESWSTIAKCRKMVTYLATVVAAVRCAFDFDDPSNPEKLPVGIARPESWSLGRSRRQQSCSSILRQHPHRGSLALVIILLERVQSAMVAGCGDVNWDCFEDFFFLGTGPIKPSVSFQREVAATLVGRLMPLNDDELVGYLRFRVYPSGAIRALLGPLEPKLIVSAPLYRWVRPKEQVPFPFQQHQFALLPTELEEDDDFETMMAAIAELLMRIYRNDYN
ncbi:expressed unknown protein [Seminavis robusta]|uniref:Uncharacterized protein n=1 Tax=Seminavis robusta TaxID=568900 RepID=A0A9N8HHD4_9STRA|nr:expressed unknown protein [Seminavis robusta]|eukprot:Sro628_g178090.1 n/a (480) ;mRNA; r:33989-35428